MTNVMLDPLPEEWEDPSTGDVYHVNCDYRIGIQISLAQYDPDLTEYDRVAAILGLMFYDGKRSQNDLCHRGIARTNAFSGSQTAGTMTGMGPVRKSVG